MKKEFIFCGSLAFLLFFHSCSGNLETDIPVCPEPDVPQQEEKPGEEHHGESRSELDWLELPAIDADLKSGQFRVTHYAEMEGKPQRNYTLLYDAEMFTSYWIAYPLCRTHMGRGRHEQWQFDPEIDRQYQTDVSRGYGGSYETVNWKDNFYARGHQLPNADRSGVREMQYQTYYSTNLTPQIHHGFNEHIWADLEAAVRSAVRTDTLYLVTGAAFQKRGTASQPIKKIPNKNDGKMLPVPNFYWKVMLKVKRDQDGTINDASAVGFWLPHQDLKGHRYMEYVTSVDQIEEWTGEDFFANLPVELQNRCEADNDWMKFKNY